MSKRHRTRNWLIFGLVLLIAMLAAAYRVAQANDFFVYDSNCDQVYAVWTDVPVNYQVPIGDTGIVQIYCPFNNHYYTATWNVADVGTTWWYASSYVPNWFKNVIPLNSCIISGYANYVDGGIVYQRWLPSGMHPSCSQQLMPVMLKKRAGTLMKMGGLSAYPPPYP